MAKKKKSEQITKPEVFKSTPFSELKGVIFTATPQPAATTPVVAASTPAAEPDDSDLFLQAMGGVSRIGKGQTSALQPNQTNKEKKPSTPHPQKPSELPKAEQDCFADAIGEMKLDIKFADQFPEEEELKPIGGNRLRQIKKGIISVERQLDLHGLTRDEALQALPRFLQNACDHGEKAVLVITGKGNNSPGEPVIQQAVAAWLRDGGKKLVLEFAPAPREMGGSGAFIVFLKNPVLQQRIPIHLKTAVNYK